MWRNRTLAPTPALPPTPRGRPCARSPLSSTVRFTAGPDNTLGGNSLVESACGLNGSVLGCGLIGVEGVRISLEPEPEENVYTWHYELNKFE